jgi:hypothetical protein
MLLHIVNGDSFGNKLKASGIPGEVLVWRESYMEGPLYPDMNPSSEHYAERRNYFVHQGVPAELFDRFSLEQEHTLQQWRSYDGIVLWFEHDLYDQAMLIYLLHRFSEMMEQKLASPPIYLLSIDAYPGIPSFKGLGQLTPEQTAALQGQWQPITQEQLELGSAAWSAYASADPKELAALMQNDLSSLPYLQRALVHHIRKFPSVSNGLNWLEQHILDWVSEGYRHPISLFQRLCDDPSDYGLGDSQFWSLLQELRCCREPLLAIQGRSLPAYGGKPPFDFADDAISLTSIGESVRTGDMDHIHLNGIDRWVGGCRLQGAAVRYRWDDQTDQIIF